MAIKIRLAFRAGSHFPLLAVMQETGIWKKLGVELETTHIVGTEDAEASLLRGDVDFVFGNHVILFRDKARGKPVAYIAQTVNQTIDKLVTRGGVKSLADLKGGSLGVHSPGDHPTLAMRLQLEEAGINMEREGISLAVDPAYRDAFAKLDAIASGKITGTFISSPYDALAERMGLNVIPLPKFEAIWGVTVATTLPTLTAGPEKADALLKAIILAVHFFKTRREETLAIMEKEVAPRLRLMEDQAFYMSKLYDDLLAILESRPYPTTKAIQNNFIMAKIEYGDEVKNLNPLSVWDVHYVRLIEQSGFIDELYQGAGV